jgi:predicted porin
MRLRGVLLASALVLGAAPAVADEYTDLLQILRAKGSLSQSEYSALLAKHRSGGARVARRRGRNVPVETAPEEATASAQARQDALAAAASAQAAQDAMRKAQAMEADMENSPTLVHAMPYTFGKGVTIRVGQIDLNFSGILNGYYTYSDAGNGRNTVAGGLTDNSGFDSSAVRNGLLPGAFIFKASTTQEGIDVSAVFGVYPGINSSTTQSPFNANSGGSPVGLGTAGVDFRQSYMTFGTKQLGTIKIGRDIGIFGSDAILSDATLLSVGASGGNAAPGNTSLGRIGIGYIYADFMPQITYISPTFAGFTATVGAFQPLDAVAFAGAGFSSTATAHDTPLFEGKLTYDFAPNKMVKGTLWAGFMVQPQQNIIPAVGPLPTSPSNKTAAAGEVGGKIDVGPFGAVGYFYRGSGVGTTGKFFDGIGLNGQLRDSEGLYAQASYKILPKLKVVGSYGQSSLYLADNEYNPLLVRRNEAEIGAVYYNLTDWVTLVGEYAHEESHNHEDDVVRANAFTAGAILFY